jgi:RNA polymerase sigma factor (sigma-70 family)
MATATEVRVEGDFDAWVSPHLPLMARVAARLAPAADVDDVVQEALSRAWRRRSTYDPGRGTAAAWLAAIVAGEARRARGRTRPSYELVDAPVEDSRRDLDLERAVASLPTRQREAVDLHYFAGLTVAETAAAMGCAEGTVKSTLSDARGRLRTLLGEDA